MYEYISGLVTSVTPKYIVIDNRGIGYKINVPNPYVYHLQDMVTVWTYFQVREDANELYGFLNVSERDLFLHLISVSGIGPKTALPILACENVEEIKEAISEGNVKLLQKFPGIGPKAAQQIILDLRGKLEFEASGIKNPKFDDCLEALMALGYNKKDATSALGKVDLSLDIAVIIKDALKVLAKK